MTKRMKKLLRKRTPRPNLAARLKFLESEFFALKREFARICEDHILLKESNTFQERLLRIANSKTNDELNKPVWCEHIKLQDGQWVRSSFPTLVVAGNYCSECGKPRPTP